MQNATSADAQSWRMQLGEIIHEVGKREQLAELIGVNPITLMRWAADTNSPRLQEIRALLRALPDQQSFRRSLLRELLGADMSWTENSSPSAYEEEPRESRIPWNFYRETLHATRDTSQRFWTICSLVLRQMLTQLDPQRLGMEVIVARCMPPGTDGKIHSLHECIGMGTPPWPDSYPVEKNLFLGAESLAGYALATGHWVATSGEDQQAELLPSKEAPHPFEVSIAAFPIILEGKVAGSLLVCSTQVRAFSRERLLLIEDYADLVRTAFHDRDFYPISAIDLGIMPHWSVQLQYFSTIQQRIQLLLREASRSEVLLDILAAERQVRQQLEEEFLQLQAEKVAADEHSII